MAVAVPTEAFDGGGRRARRGRAARALPTALVAALAALWLVLRLTLHLWWPLYPTVGASMYPAIAPGELAVVGAMAPGHLPRVGEIVLVRVPAVDQRTYGYDALVLHRVVAVGGGGRTAWFRTKGDHNRAADPFRLAPSDIVGRLVTLVPYVGYAFLFARSRYGLIALVALVVLAVVYRVVDWALREAERAAAATAATAAAGSAPAAALPAAPAPGAAVAAAALAVAPAQAGAPAAIDADVAEAVRELAREVRALRQTLEMGSLWVVGGGADIRPVAPAPRLVAALGALSREARYAGGANETGDARTPGHGPAVMDGEGAEAARGPRLVPPASTRRTGG